MVRSYVTLLCTFKSGIDKLSINSKDSNSFIVQLYSTIERDTFINRNCKACLQCNQDTNQMWQTAFQFIFEFLFLPSSKQKIRFGLSVFPERMCDGQLVEM